LIVRLHVINGFEKDCLLLERQGRFALVDGGSAGTFEHHLQPYLQQQLGTAGTLDAVIVSQVDSDHSAGVVDLLADLERARVDGDARTVTVADVWYNSFGATMDNPEGSLQSSLQAMMSLAGRSNVAAANGASALLGIKQGARLRRLAIKLGIPLNGAFGGQVISQEQQTGVKWGFGDTTFEVVGPTAANLRELQRDWVTWIENNLDAFATGNVAAMANADQGIPNLSSIVLLGATPKGDVLLTGDARGDHILQGLEQAGAVSGGGARQFRLIKVQHHGSDRNITREFFDRLTADIYVISADGKHGNADDQVLTMLVDSAHAAGRTPLIVVTNDTPSVASLAVSRPASQFGYTLAVRSLGEHAMVVDLETGAIA
jgi:hypothetical protein